MNEPAGTQNTGGLCHAENSHAPAPTDRPYRVQIRALRPVYRDKPTILHMAHKKGSEVKFVHLTKMNESSGKSLPTTI